MAVRIAAHRRSRRGRYRVPAAPPIAGLRQYL